MSTEEALARHKKIRGGHRSSATRLMRQIEEANVTADIMLDKLLQWKVSINEKLTKIRTLDDEILAFIDSDAIDDEIEQADVLSERLQLMICRVEQLILKVSSVSVLVVRHHLTVEVQQ